MKAFKKARQLAFFFFFSKDFNETDLVLHSLKSLGVCELILSIPSTGRLLETAHPLMIKILFSELLTRKEHKRILQSFAFRTPVQREFQSRVNIPVLIGGPSGNKDLEAKFVEESTAAGLVGLKGHR